MQVISIGLSDENLRKLNEMAKVASMQNETLCSLIVSAFLEGGGGSSGGKIHVGSWENGIRVVIDWPKYLIKRVEKKDLVDQS